MRAKFKVNSVTAFERGQLEVKLVAVSGGSPENQSFNKYTPYGELKFMIDNPDNPQATAFFEPGEEYFIDFSKAK